MAQKCWFWFVLYHKWFTSCDRKNGFLFWSGWGYWLILININVGFLLCFFFCLDTKETKIIHGFLLFFGIHESLISSVNIFIPKIIGRIFLSRLQPLVFHTRLRGHSLRPAHKPRFRIRNLLHLNSSAKPSTYSHF